MLDDHDRPLNKRGRASAKVIGKWLKERGYLPDDALVSTAERTRETWKLIARQLAAPPAPIFATQLYHAEPDAMQHMLRTTTGRCVMMIGHNPGLAYFAQGLVHQPPADSRFERFPTGATAVIDFDIEAWSELVWRTGTVVDFAAPRDLLPGEDQS